MFLRRKFPEIMKKVSTQEKLPGNPGSVAKTKEEIPCGGSQRPEWPAGPLPGSYGFQVIAPLKFLHDPGERKAGRVGPRRMFRMPKASRAIRMQTAFCSNQQSTSESGRSLTVQPKASARASAIRMALYASLHWPTSRMRGRPVPGTVPEADRSAGIFRRQGSE